MSGGRERQGSMMGSLMRKASQKLGLAPSESRRRAASRSASGAPDGEMFDEEEMDDFGARKDWSIHTFHGHDSSVYGCTFTPGAETFVSGGRDKTLRLWQMPAVPGVTEVPAQPIRTVRGHSGFVLACDVSPTGKQVITGSEDSKVYMWETSTGKQIATMSGHSSKVYAASYTPSTSPCAGAHIVTGSLDQTVRIWDVESQRQRCLLRGHMDNVFTARFCGDANLIVSGGDDKDLFVWDFRQQREVFTLSGHRATVWSAVWNTANTEVLSCGMGSELIVFDVRQRKEKFRADGVHDGTPTHQALYSASGNEVITCGRDKMIQIRENGPGLPLVHSLKGHNGTVYHIDLHPDGEHLLSSSVDTTLKLWALSERSQ
eukprot:TRINITY_DN39996_c0_g1_i1.p1 TRINITY_DN39996_c0_g1~~TRINITY_DN39996_c0_g1_i1.p1  ORF type:complete len:374 (+),score=69.67 TRINITY_DN39996_c0_g1_i1:61-1182(+)